MRTSDPGARTCHDDGCFGGTESQVLELAERKAVGVAGTLSDALVLACGPMLDLEVMRSASRRRWSGCVGIGRASFIAGIEGDPSNVLGLCVPLLRRMLASVGARGRRRAWVGACAALALVGQYLAAPAGAAPAGASGSAVTVALDASGPVVGAVNKALIGTNSPTAGAGAIMSKIGVHWARTDFDFDSAYDCSTGIWDPSAVDQRIREDLAMGGTPQLIFDYSPPCMTTGLLHHPHAPPNADGYGPWRALVEEAAYYVMVTYGVHVFEVWNEPDWVFWTGTLADYLQLYQQTAIAVEVAAQRAGMHDVLIGGPALFYPDPFWLVPFLAFVSRNHLPLGFVSWHLYANDPLVGPIIQIASVVIPPYIPALGPYWYNPLLRAQIYPIGAEVMKALIAHFPSLHPLIVIDEWNVDAGYDARQDGPYDAAFAAAVLDGCQAAGVDRMAFFNIADGATTTTGNSGMLYHNLEPKPVYWAFYFWHALGGSLLATRLSPNQSGAERVGRIGAVASRAADTQLSVLIYNFAPYDPTGGYGTVDPNPYDHEVTLAVSGLGGGAWRYSVRMVDASSSGSIVAAGAVPATGRIVLEMPGESVALVQLSRSPGA